MSKMGWVIIISSLVALAALGLRGLTSGRQSVQRFGNIDTATRTKLVAARVRLDVEGKCADEGIGERPCSAEDRRKIGESCAYFRKLHQGVPTSALPSGESNILGTCELNGY